MFANFRLATLRFTPAIKLPSRLAYRKLQPSIRATEPEGSSKFDFCKEAPSRLVQTIRTPNN